MLKIFFFLVPVLFIAPRCFGHGDLHQRIANTTEAIKKYPDSSYLYLKRGVLFYQHEEYNHALNDFHCCKTRGFQHNDLNFYLAKTYFNLNQFSMALQHIDADIDATPSSARSHMLKGNILSDMEEYDTAAPSLEKGIQLSEKTTPEAYIELSGVYTNSSFSDAPSRSKQAIKKGIKDIGPLYVFYHELIDNAIARHQFQEAIDYQTILLNRSSRKERAFYNRARLYLLAGELEFAFQDLVQANKAINQLKNRHRNTSSIIVLRSKINALIDGLQQRI